MATPRRLRFVRWQVIWMLVTTVTLSSLGVLSPELFGTVSLIGFLVVTELTAPAVVTPRWRTRVWKLIAIGVLGFALLVTRRILRTASVDFAIV